MLVELAAVGVTAAVAHDVPPSKETCQVLVSLHRPVAWLRNLATEAVTEPVAAVLLPSVLSVNVTVWLAAELSVTPNVFVPATKAALADGENVAPPSLEVIAIVSVAVVTFQLSSTAFT